LHCGVAYPAEAYYYHRSTYGASLKAFYILAKQQSYAFVSCNSAGCNAFFVRRNLKPDIVREQTIEEGYAGGQFREARKKDGKLAYLSKQEEEINYCFTPIGRNRL
jgi:hypothetical protein